MRISFTTRGTWDKTDAYLKKMKDGEIFRALDKYGAVGAAALQAATPVDSGLTQNSWDYEIKNSRGYYSIRWFNGNSVAGVPLVIMLQYGHGTGTGGYVAGRDFINPAIRPVFEQISAEIDRVVRG